MLHRITWIALPVVGLVVVGSGLGWWGYNQNRQRASLVQQVENQYTASLYQLVNHTVSMEDEIGKSLISGEKKAFQSHLRQVWRLSYAAQTDDGRLPVQLMPLHSVHSYLSTVEKNTANWLNNDSDGRNSAIRQKLESYYGESKQLIKGLSQIQSHVMAMDSTWQTAIVESGQSRQSSERGTNQIMDGLRTVDTQTAAHSDSLETLTRSSHTSVASLHPESVVTSEQAKTNVAKYFNVRDFSSLRVEPHRKNTRVSVFIVQGNTSNGPFTALVTQNGGHVLSFDTTDHRSQKTLNFAQAQQTAVKWLQTHGFSKVTRVTATQFGQVAYFVFVPVVGKASVLNQNLSVRVSLDSRQIIGFDGRSYFEHPLLDVPQRRYSIATLRNKFGAHFQIRAEEEAIALDPDGNYQPAVLFYGTGGRETYRMLVNANNGNEMSVEQLTRHE